MSEKLITNDAPRFIAGEPYKYEQVNNGVSLTKGGAKKRKTRRKANKKRHTKRARIIRRERRTCF